MSIFKLKKNFKKACLAHKAFKTMRENEKELLVLTMFSSSTKLFKAAFVLNERWTFLASIHR